MVLRLKVRSSILSARMVLGRPGTNLVYDATQRLRAGPAESALSLPRAGSPPPERPLRPPRGH
eukprot:1525386-Rhodomonas_salina.1